jgi:uncharacterized repeat protein (TIGR03803 family)
MKTLNQVIPCFVITFALASGTTRADWAPPEVSVVAPAVLTLDAFATNGEKGANPNGPLVFAPDGNLYGSTVNGGTNGLGAAFGGFGTLFRVTTGGAFTDLYDFGFLNQFGPTQENPGPLVLGPGGELFCGGVYGTDQYSDGFIVYYPAVFRLRTDRTVSLAYLDPLNPGGKVDGLLLGPDGALYGTEDNRSSVFRLAADGSVTNFLEIGASHLVAGPDGALYGSAGGGTYNKGTLFRLTTSGAFTDLHDFNGTDGLAPGALVVGPDLNLYGSTDSGGTQNKGTLFRVTTNGTFTKVHDFNGTDGNSPRTAIVVGRDGAMYGSTYFGGTSDRGTLFRLTTGGSFTKLHDFVGTDGSEPSVPMVAGPDGALYGTTFNGGTNDNGTLFRLTTGGTFTKLHDFNGTNGSYPGALVEGPDGALYGSTSSGGPQGGGVLFKLVLERPPTVSIARSNAFVIVSWPVTSLDVQLQENTDPSLQNSWSSVVQAAVTNFGQVSVTVPATAGRKFFRLKSQ